MPGSRPAYRDASRPTRAVLGNVVPGALSGKPSRTATALPPRLAATAWVMGVLFTAGGFVQASPAAAQTPVAPAGQTANLGDIAPVAAQELYLDVSVNSQPTQLIVRFVLRGGQLYATGKDLQEIGILTDKLGLAADAEVALKDIPGLHYRYDAARLTVDLTLPDAIRRPFLFNARESAPPPAAASQRGIVLNYDFFVESNPRPQSSLFGELRYFTPSGVLDSTGLYNNFQDGQTFIRLDTSWSRSKQATLSTLQIGDTISSSLAYSRSVRLGGIQWRSNFTLRPDLITYPIPSLAGSSVVPSSVDLYVNGIRQFSGQVPSGPFVLNQVPGVTGAGQATVVTRDAQGRSLATTVPLYVDTRLLSPGLSSYSVETGFIRRNYGVASFDYDPRPAVSATGSRGITSSITVNGHAEAAPDVYNGGAGILFELGQAGVLSGALSASTGAYSGQQVSLGYQFVGPHFTVDMETLRARGNYGDLGSRTGDPVPRATDRATLSFPFLGQQTMAFSYIGLHLPDGPSSKIGSISYIVRLGNLGSANLSVFRDFGNTPTSGVFLSFNFSLGNSRSGGTGTSINTSVGRENGQNTYNVSATRPADYGGGFGWGVQAGRSGTLSFQQAQAQYLGSSGQATAAIQSFGGHAAGTVDLSGAVVVMDGTVITARRIDDSFALVSTDGVAHVPVLHENRVIGETNSRGYLLVPDLSSYQHNQVSIDSMKLPADTRVSTTAMDLVPEAHTGVLGHFGIAHYQAAAVTLHDAKNQPLPVGLRVRLVGTDKESIVGYDGQTFIDGLSATNVLQVTRGGQSCEVTFPYQPTKDGSLQNIGPLTCALPAAAGPGK